MAGLRGCRPGAADEALASAAMGPVLAAALQTVIDQLGSCGELAKAIAVLAADWEAFRRAAQTVSKFGADIAYLHERHDALQPLAEQSRDLIRQIDQLYKLADKAHGDAGGKRGRANPLKALEEARAGAVEQLKLVRYFHRQAHWLLSCFPDAQLVAVPELVKLVDHAELAANEWPLGSRQ